MSDLKSLIEEVSAAEASGARFTCAFGESRTATRQTAAVDVSERWNTAVDAALLQTRGNRQRAVAIVAKRHPQLRQELVAAANANRQQPVARATSQPVRVSASGEFRQRVQTLVDGGMSKLEAAKLLSKQMGLSQEPRRGFVSTPDRYR